MSASTHRLSPRTTRSGFTLIELLIGMSLLFLLTAGLIGSVASLRGLTVAGSVDSQLQDMGVQAMNSILPDLKRSGFDAPGGVSYPYLFDDGVAGAPFQGHSHAAAVKHAVAGDPDFGVNRELVFLRLRDADGDGVPDLDLQGMRVWDASVVSYVVVTRNDGTNVLQRRVNAGNPRIVARHVERITFDDNASSGFVVPLRAIRVRIWFRRQDEQGRLHRFFTEATVDLRNG